MTIHVLEILSKNKENSSDRVTFLRTLHRHSYLSPFTIEKRYFYFKKHNFDLTAIDSQRTFGGSKHATENNNNRPMFVD